MLKIMFRDIKYDIDVRVNALEEDSTELNNVRAENEDLENLTMNL